MGSTSKKKAASVLARRLERIAAVVVAAVRVLWCLVLLGYGDFLEISAYDFEALAEILDSEPIRVEA